MIFSQKFNFKLYRNQQYIIDIYFDQYIENHDVKIIAQILINILKEYKKGVNNEKI